MSIDSKFQVPTVALHTDMFEKVVRSVCRFNGMPGMRYAFVPQPVMGKTAAELRAYVDGNFGFTRGLAELVDASGKVIARVRFTDVFTYRDGRWQALAGHESLLSQAAR